MNVYDIRFGTRLLVEKASSTNMRSLQAPLIIGISGPVASGKTYLVRILQQLLSGEFGIPVIHVPFDYWINPHKLGAPTYADRFYLDEFSHALESMAQGEFWMCPRSDLNKSADFSERQLKKATEIVWRGRRFQRLDHLVAEATTNIDDLYVEVASRRVFSLSPGLLKGIYVIEGTLIFHSEHMRSLYNLRAYCFAKWANRIARMTRRYKRREVFAATSKSLAEYVSFLVNEANQCADKEIANQLDENMIQIESSVDTVSNLLDLYYLRQQLPTILSGPDASLLTIEAVETAIAEALERLSTLIQDGSTVVLQEFTHLTESHHLLNLKNVDEIFVRLRGISSVGSAQRKLN